MYLFHNLFALSFPLVFKIDFHNCNTSLKNNVRTTLVVKKWWHWTTTSSPVDRLKYQSESSPSQWSLVCKGRKIYVNSTLTSCRSLNESFHMKTK